MIILKKYFLHEAEKISVYCVFYIERRNLKGGGISGYRPPLASPSFMQTKSRVKAEHISPVKGQKQLFVTFKW